MKNYLKKSFEKADQISPCRIRTLDRYKLAELFNKFGLKIGAEIGVERGVFSKAMCSRIPGLKLYCIDPWKFYEGYKEHVPQERLDGFYSLAKERLEPFDATLIKSTSMKALKLIPDESLDFVYIDGNHEFDYVMQDLISWSKKVKKGGVVAGHDYYRFRKAGVIEAVDIYTKMHNIKEWFITDERTPSFFWIK